MKKLFFSVLLFCSVGVLFAQQTVRVAVMQNAMPVSALGQQHAHGFAVDIFSQLMRRSGYRIKWVPVTKEKQGYQLLRQHKVDAAVGLFSQEFLHNHIANYSFPFFINELGVLYRHQPVTLAHVMKAVFSPLVIEMFIGIIVLSTLIAMLIWIYERNHNSAIMQNKRSLGFAWYYVLNVMFYGVNLPASTWPARLVSLVWLMVRIAFMVSVTSIVTSNLVNTFRAGNIGWRNLADFNHLSVDVLLEDHVAKLLEAHGAVVHVRSSESHVVRDVLSGKADAAVESKAIAEYYLRHHHNAPVRISQFSLSNELLSFAFSKQFHGNKILEHELLNMQSKGLVKPLCSRYLRSEVLNCI